MTSAIIQVALIVQIYSFFKSSCPVYLDSKKTMSFKHSNINKVYSYTKSRTISILYVMRGQAAPQVIKDVWVIDQACSVKMAGYWPSSLFAFLWTETKSRTIETPKRTRPIFSHLDRTSLVNKKYIIWPNKKIFSRGMNARNSRRAR